MYNGLLPFIFAIFCIPFPIPKFSCLFKMCPIVIDIRSLTQIPVSEFFEEAVLWPNKFVRAKHYSVLSASSKGSEQVLQGKLS
jgi:hypothetical protein